MNYIRTTIVESRETDARQEQNTRIPQLQKNLKLIRYNLNLNNFFLARKHLLECEGMIKNIQLFQNSLNYEVQSFTMINCFRPDVIILEPKVDQPYYSLDLAMVYKVMLILYVWLRTVQSDNITRGAFSSTSEILKRREKIRYVFQHNSSFFFLLF